MIKFIIKNFKFLAVIFSFSLFAFSFCQAAVLYLEPSETQYQPGDVFIVDIRIDTEEECINTIEANLNFPQNVLEIVDFSKGESIITLWVKPLEINQEKGEISFSGGIPGGYCGRIPGDPGESNLLGRIIFKVKENNREQFPAKIGFLESSQVLLNDGLGTKCELTFQKAVFTILPEPLDYAQGKDEWQEELQKDIILPEPFEIKIHQDPAIFEGKYFITFFTADKQTGLDYFEIKEGGRDWKKAASPYLLEDQTLQSIIKVIAIDKAGNKRIAEYIPEISKKPFSWWIIIVVLIGVIWWTIKKLKIKNKNLSLRSRTFFR